jgi:type III secretion protein N (ATPase)
MSDLHDLTRLMESELASAAMLTRTGKVTEVVGTLMRVSGLDARLGELCEVLDDDGSVLQMAEVVASQVGDRFFRPSAPSSA